MTVDWSSKQFYHELLTITCLFGNPTFFFFFLNNPVTEVFINRILNLLNNNLITEKQFVDMVVIHSNRFFLSSRK